MGKLCSKPNSRLKLLKSQKVVSLLKIPTFNVKPLLSPRSIAKPPECASALIFDVAFSQFQLRNLEKRRYQYVIVVSWDGIVARSRFVYSEDGILNIDSDHIFTWFGGESLNQLKSSYLVIALYKLEGFRTATLVGYMFVSIFNLAVGPVMNDFVLTRSNDIHIKFQCQISQICKMVVSFAELAVNLTNDNDLGETNDDFDNSNVVKRVCTRPNNSNWRLRISATDLYSIASTQWSNTTLTPHWVSYGEKQYQTQLDELILISDTTKDDNSSSNASSTNNTLLDMKCGQLKKFSCHSGNESSDNEKANLIGLNGNISKPNSSKTKNSPNLPDEKRENEITEPFFPATFTNNTNNNNNSNSHEKKFSTFSEEIPKDLNNFSNNHSNNSNNANNNANNSSNRSNSYNEGSNITTSQKLLQLKTSEASQLFKKLSESRVTSDNNSDQQHTLPVDSQANATYIKNILEQSPSKIVLLQDRSSQVYDIDKELYSDKKGSNSNSGNNNNGNNSKNTNRLSQRQSTLKNLLGEKLDLSNDTNDTPASADEVDCFVIDEITSADIYAVKKWFEEQRDLCIQQKQTFCYSSLTPYLAFCVTPSDLREQSLNIRLYGRPVSSKEEVYSAEAWIPFFKILDVASVREKDRCFFAVKFCEGLYEDGIYKGSISGVLVMQNIPVVVQMFAGVNTDLGFRSTVLPVMRSVSLSATKSPTLVRLASLLNNLQREWTRLQSIHSTDQTNFNPFDSLSVVADICEDLIKLLSPDEKKVFAQIDYASIDGLACFQTLILDLAMLILQTFKVVSWTTKNLYYKLLLIVIHRPELDLSNIVPAMPSYFPENPKLWNDIFSTAVRSDANVRLFAGNDGRASHWNRLKNLIFDTNSHNQNKSDIFKDNDDLCLRGHMQYLPDDFSKSTGIYNSSFTNMTKKSSLEYHSSSLDSALSHLFSTKGMATEYDQVITSKKNFSKTHNVMTSQFDDSQSFNNESISVDCGSSSSQIGSKLSKTKLDFDSSNLSVVADSSDNYNCQSASCSATVGIESSKSHYKSYDFENIRSVDRSNAISMTTDRRINDDDAVSVKSSVIRTNCFTASRPLKFLDGKHADIISQGTLGKPITYSDHLNNSYFGNAPMKIPSSKLSNIGTGNNPSINRNFNKNVCSDLNDCLYKNLQNVTNDVYDTNNSVVFLKNDILRSQNQQSLTAMHNVSSGAVSGLPDLETALNYYEGVAEILLFRRRLAIAHQALEFLLATLKHCIFEVSASALFESQRRYLSALFSVLFIRLPTLQKLILRKVLTPAERTFTLVSWRLTDFPLDEISLDASDRWSNQQTPWLNEIRMVLDWQPFITLLHSYYGDNCDEESLVETTVADHDFVWLHPRSTMFFYFLSSWIKSLSRLFNSNKTQKSFMIRWDLIPGYPTMLKAFLLELRNRPLSRYPDALLSCSGIIISNSRLLTVFLLIVFYKTNLYNRDDVNFAFEHTEFWLKSLKFHDCEVPSNFDSRVLTRAAQLVLSSDLAVQMTRCLSFLYNNLRQFAKHRRFVSFFIEVCLNNLFYDLLFHWSYHVRVSFIHIILFQVCNIVRTIVVHNCLNNNKNVCLTTEQRLWCWGYILIRRNLENKNIKLLTNIGIDVSVLIRLLIIKSTSQDSLFGYLLWKIPYTLPITILEEQKKLEISPVAVESTRSDLLNSIAFIRRRNNNQQSSLSLKESNSCHSSLTFSNFEDNSDISRSLNASYNEQSTGILNKTSKWAIGRVFDARLKRSSRAKLLNSQHSSNQSFDNVDVSESLLASCYQYLPQIKTETAERPVYLKKAIKEIARITTSYREWLTHASSNDNANKLDSDVALPPIGIPNSPLDSNVEVPLD